MCMPHRGRLNVLTGLLQYPVSLLFHKARKQTCMESILKCVFWTVCGFAL